MMRMNEGFFRTTVATDNPSFDRRARTGHKSVEKIPAGTLVCRYTGSIPVSGERLAELVLFEYLLCKQWVDSILLGIYKPATLSALVPLDESTLTVAEVAGMVSMPPADFSYLAVCQLVNDGNLTAMDLHRAYQLWCSLHPDDQVQRPCHDIRVRAAARGRITGDQA